MIHGDVRVRSVAFRIVIVTLRRTGRSAGRQALQWIVGEIPGQADFGYLRDVTHRVEAISKRGQSGYAQIVANAVQSPLQVVTKARDHTVGDFARSVAPGAPRKPSGRRETRFHVRPITTIGVIHNQVNCHCNSSLQLKDFI